MDQNVLKCKVPIGDYEWFPLKRIGDKYFMVASKPAFKGYFSLEGIDWAASRLYKFLNQKFVAFLDNSGVDISAISGMSILTQGQYNLYVYNKLPTCGEYLLQTPAPNHPEHILAVTADGALKPTPITAQTGIRPCFFIDADYLEELNEGPVTTVDEFYNAQKEQAQAAELAAIAAAKAAEEQARAEAERRAAEEKRKAEEEAARLAAIAEAKRIAEERRLAEEREAARIAAEQEAARRAAEEAAAAEAARIEAERLEAERIAAEKARLEAEEAARKAEEEAARLAAEAEAKRLAEESARIEAEKEAQRLAAEEEAKRLTEERRLAEEADQRRREEEERRIAEEEARIAAEREVARVAEEKARREAEERARQEADAAEAARRAAIPITPPEIPEEAEAPIIEKESHTGNTKDETEVEYLGQGKKIETDNKSGTRNVYVYQDEFKDYAFIVSEEDKKLQESIEKMGVAIRAYMQSSTNEKREPMRKSSVQDHIARLQNRWRGQ